MRIELALDGDHYFADLDSVIDITIPLDFEGEQPNHFEADQASRRAFEVPGFSGRTTTGASCNVDELTLVPHCNGTHTETIGHLLHEQTTTADLVLPALIPAVLVTVTPTLHSQTTDCYDPAFEAEDSVISRDQLAQALDALGGPQVEALILRTNPNPESKKTRRYGSKDQPAFLTIEAAQLLSELEIQHLVVDLPSIDRSRDEGRLSVHRIFWEIKAGSHGLGERDTTQRTITELAFIPSQAPDGHYLLSLGVPRFRSDAAPARASIVELQVAT